MKVASKKKHKIKREMVSEKPTIWVGKRGVNPELIQEISKQLKKHEIVKVRVLRSNLKKEDRGDVPQNIASKTGSTLIEVRGNTFILYKPRKRSVHEKPLYEAS